MSQPVGFWNGFERLILMLTFISIILGGIAFFWEMGDRREARGDRKAEAIDRAWTRLLAPAVGNTGKAEAMRYLNTQNQNMSGIDLSCKRMSAGQSWDEDLSRCSAPIALTRSDLSGILLANANLNGADLRASTFSKGHLQGTKLRGANLHSTDFNGANLEDAVFSRSNLYQAHFIDANLTNADLSGSFLSSADFSRANGLASVILKDAWAWADLPPKGLKSKWINLCKFNDQIHKRHLLPPLCQQ
ncbi:MAG: pentapeptide repeat-containing protein [Planktotalea sp.]|uniref:pentapeptide repeat-containing protein n=1 Tax=Planktotalea sp. TaxID=2029877 RepID=UPI003C77498A